MMDLSYLLDHLAADPFFKKFLHLNEKLAEVIQDYSLVSFVPLNVQVSVAVSFYIHAVCTSSHLIYIYIAAAVHKVMRELLICFVILHTDQA